MRYQAVQAEVDRVDTEEIEERGYSIDEEDMGEFIAILSEYVNPIGSVVREVTSNAHDSHSEAAAYKDKSLTELMNEGYSAYINKKEGIDSWISYLTKLKEYFKNWVNVPVRVELIRKGEFEEVSSMLEIEDFGVGMSPTRIDQVYKKYFKSTKRKTGDQMGAFGLGAKSPIGYLKEEPFIVITRWFGTEYVYEIRMGNKYPLISLVEEVDTKRGNGTLIQIPIKEGDVAKFSSEINTQLVYFTNTNIINIPNDSESQLPENTESVIYEGDHFIYKEGNNSSGLLNNLHLCLGKVYYPLLDRYSYNIKSNLLYLPIALKFTSDEITGPIEKEGMVSIIHTRESVKQNKATKEAIEKKAKLAFEELKELYESLLPTCSNVEEYYKNVYGEEANKLHFPDGTVLNLDLTSLSDKKISFPKYGSLPKLPEHPYRIGWNVYAKVLSGRKYDAKYETIQSLIRNDSKLYIIKNKRSNTKRNKYLDWKNYEDFYLIYFDKDSIVDTKNDSIHSHIYSIFGLNPFATPISEEDKKLIKQFIADTYVYLNKIHEIYDDIEPSDEYEKYLKDKKKSSKIKRKKRRIAGIVPVKRLDWDRSSNEYSWSIIDIKIEDLQFSEAFTIYGFQDDDEKLLTVGNIIFNIKRFGQNAWSTDNNKRRINQNRARVLKVAKSREEFFEENPQAFNVNDFLTSNHTLIMRFITAYKIFYKLTDAFRKLDNKIIEEIKPDVYKKVKRVLSYVDTYYMHTTFSDSRLYEVVRYIDDREASRKKNVKLAKKYLKLAKKQPEMAFTYKAKAKRLSKDAPLYDYDLLRDLKDVSDFIKSNPLINALNVDTVDKEALKRYIYGFGPRK